MLEAVKVWLLSVIDVLEFLKGWLWRVFDDFLRLPPTQQVTWSLGVIGAIYAAYLWTHRKFVEREKKTDSTKLKEAVGAPGALVTRPATIFAPRWEYQWAIGDSVLPRAVEPSLSVAIIDEIRRAAASGKESFLIFVRGELGIGKSTLAAILHQALNAAARAMDEDHQKIANFIETAIVSEANDLQPAHEFAREIGSFLETGGAVIALGRPGTLDVVERRLARAPDATVTMLPFEPARPLFHECISTIAAKFELEDTNRRKLHEIASRFDQRFLQTPFYFEQVASALSGDSDIEADNLSPLQIFEKAIQLRLRGSGVFFPDLVDVAISSGSSGDTLHIPGIVNENTFIHDGYRNVVLAAAFVTGEKEFLSIVQCENAIPAIRIILSHLRSSRRPDDPHLPFEAELRQFSIEETQLENRYYPIYIQGLVAEVYRQLKDEIPAETVRNRCIRLIEQRDSGHDSITLKDFSLWWDVSDALSAVNDPRLLRARHLKYGPDSGYFTQLSQTSVEIGSIYIPRRSDIAKPVLPFHRTHVSIGPFWIANFPVTNEEFLEFWDHPSRDRCFQATGAQWLRRDPELMHQVEVSFDISARRCFWKEMLEQEAVAVSGIRSDARSPLDLARKKALRAEEQVALWDPAQADDRFSGRGKPVVGVNWWEAMAFCEWWTRFKMPGAGFPMGSRANLLTDWEWEAVRRLFYEPADLADCESYAIDRYPAHTRSAQVAIFDSRIGNVMRPLHVGLTLAPAGRGPADLVGNVWEWTRSRIFGRIVASDVMRGDFGQTAWEDGSAEEEQIPCAISRDRTDEENDLTYRALRGGSFFSRDEQAAWNPAYRLCDPPFNSFIDLGFRFAVYPPNAK